MFSKLPRTSRRAYRARSFREPGKRNRIWVAFGACGVGVGVVVVIFSGFFSITSVEVRGVDGVTETAVRQRLASATGENLVFLDTGELEEDLLSYFSALSRVVVRRDWPKGLRVDAVEREPLGVWCRPRSRDQECYLFDHERAWGHGVPSTGTIMLTVMDHHPEGSPATALVENIVMLAEHLRELDIGTAQVVLPKGSLDEIHMMTTQGYPIYFSILSGLNEQLEVFEIFLGEIRTNGEFSPKYIDVRVPGKVYYKE